MSLSPPPPPQAILNPHPARETTKLPHVPREAQLHEDQLLPSSNLCPSHHWWPWGHVGPVDCRVEEGRTPKESFQLSLEGKKPHPISSLQHPAVPPLDITPGSPQSRTLDLPATLLCCFVTTYLFIQ